MACQNQYQKMTVSAAATIAPIVLWSDRYRGNLYLTGKNTFLEFYTDENKAIKRCAYARSVSADSRFTSSDFSTATTTTPTSTNQSNRSGSPSNRSTLSSDNEGVQNADTYQYHDDGSRWIANDDDDYFDSIASPGYQMTMIPMMMPETPEDIKEVQKKKQPEVIKPRITISPKEPTANQSKPAKKQDLKKFQKTALPNEYATTLMIRGIPCSFSQEALVSLIDNAGFKGKYNFFYLPRDGNRSSNLGYAFINMVDCQSAQLCISTFTGVPLAAARSTKTCTVSPADIQGLPNLRKHFQRTAVNRGSRGPVFIKV